MGNCCQPSQFENDIITFKDQPTNRENLIKDYNYSNSQRKQMNYGLKHELKNDLQMITTSSSGTPTRVSTDKSKALKTSHTLNKQNFQRMGVEIDSSIIEAESIVEEGFNDSSIICNDDEENNRDSLFKQVNVRYTREDTTNIINKYGFIFDQRPSRVNRKSNDSITFSKASEKRKESIQKNDISGLMGQIG